MATTSVQQSDALLSLVKAIENGRFATLADDLWIAICNYLEPFERFKLCRCCIALNCLLCREHYPFYSFYLTDIDYWMENLEWITSPIGAPHDRHDDNALESYAINLYHFDSLSTNALLSIKYYILFYDKISQIRVNKTIEKMQHLFDCKQASNNIMSRLSEDEHEETSIFELDLDNDDDKIIDAQLKELRIDLNPDTEYLPSTIIHIYCHEIPNHNQCMIHWICDIIAHCDSNCGVLTETHLDKSSLDNTSIEYLCNALLSRIQLRQSPLNSIRHLFFTGNIGITDDCVERLLGVLQQTCPNLVGIYLNDTGITNQTCHTIHDFYVNANAVARFGYIDLSSNDKIDCDGIDILNDMFSELKQRNVDIKVEVNISNCMWSVPKLDWCENIIYDK
eukprot:1025345_1